MADDRAKRIAKAIGPLRVKPGTTVHLGRDFDPRYKAGFLKKKEGVDVYDVGTDFTPFTTDV